MQIVIVGAGVAGAVDGAAIFGISGVKITCLERVARNERAEAGTGLKLLQMQFMSCDKQVPNLPIRLLLRVFHGAAGLHL